MLSLAAADGLSHSPVLRFYIVNLPLTKSSHRAYDMNEIRPLANLWCKLIVAWMAVAFPRPSSGLAETHIIQTKPIGEAEALGFYLVFTQNQAGDP